MPTGIPAGPSPDTRAQQNGRERRRARVPGEKTAQLRLGSSVFKKKGVSRFDVRDPYYLAVALTWPQFLLAFITVYVFVNLTFATLFWIVPGTIGSARPASFSDAFFFSNETLTTVGYGDMYPATLYGHLVVMAEIVCGMAFAAILTGLTFVRFSRPRAKLMFAPYPVVATHNGVPTLMVRIGNGRPDVLLDARAKLNVLQTITTAEGERFRRAQELRLERAHLPVFPLTWTLMHVLDEQSPLYGYDRDQVVAARAQILVTIEGHDPTLATSICEIRNYAPEDMHFNMRYADAIAVDEDGTAVADLTRIGLLEPDVGGHQAHGWTDREDAVE